MDHEPAMDRMIEYISRLWDEKDEKEWTEEQRLMSAVIVERSRIRTAFIKQLDERMAEVERLAQDSRARIAVVADRVTSLRNAAVPVDPVPSTGDEVLLHELHERRQEGLQ